MFCNVLHILIYMNQIIYPENLSDNFKKYDEYIKSKKKVYKYIFILAIFFLMAFIGYYLWRYFKISKKENVANKILTVYDIQKLYAESKPIEIPCVISETGDTAYFLRMIFLASIVCSKVSLDLHYNKTGVRIKKIRQY